MNIPNPKIILILLFIALTLQAENLFSQERFADSIQLRMQQYTTTHVNEKLFIHTDKEFYMPGEIIWFKIYCTDNCFHYPLDVSSVCYIEILNSEGKSIIQGKIALHDGSGNGSLVVPASVNSANYLLRAYTNWMKNFGSASFFQKIITVVNPAGGPPTSETQKKNNQIRFFPEGGNLVYGIESKVAFEIYNSKGSADDASGFIINQRKDTVARFKPLKFGMGQFSFKPDYPDQYSVLVIISNGESFNGELSQIYNEGSVMRLTEEESDHLKIVVESNIPNTSGFYLLTSCHEAKNHAWYQPASSNKAAFTIDKNQLGPGISTLTIFNSDRKPVCERLYFKKPEKKLLLGLNIDQTEFLTRQKVQFDVSSKDATGKLTASDLSISVFLQDSLQQNNAENIYSYLWLSSELRLPAGSGVLFFQSDAPDLKTASENLLLVRGWRKFQWDSIFSGSQNHFEFLPEYSGPVINAKLIDKRTGLPASKIITFLSIPGPKFLFRSSTSDEKGKLIFDAGNFYGPGELVLQTNYLTDSNCRIDLVSPFIERPSGFNLPLLKMRSEFNEQLLSRITAVQVENAYSSKKTQQFFAPENFDSTAFYGSGDNAYNLDDYTRFRTMEEDLREYVPEVQVRKTKGKYHFHVLNLPYKVFFEKNPLVLIDGVPEFDIDNFISFDPLKIRRLEVIAGLYHFGSMDYNGIVSAKTYQGDLAGYQLNPGALIVSYEGLQLQREFYSPTYESSMQKENRIPDFRNVLYWNADIKTGSEGKKHLSFYTSDLPGKYVVLVQGINNNGSAGSAVQIISVRKR